jgi:hypothetical protein
MKPSLSWCVHSKLAGLRSYIAINYLRLSLTLLTFLVLGSIAVVLEHDDQHRLYATETNSDWRFL